MPTGYTAELVEKGQDFRSFVLTCSRAMGACIMQRDDPMSDPPKMQPVTSYHADKIGAAKIMLAELQALTVTEKLRHGARLRDTAIASARESLAREQAETARLDAMAEKVSAWTPPSPEHEGLKRFMLEQLQTSKTFNYAEKWMAEAEAKTSHQYFTEALERAAHDIEYHTKEHAEELKRSNARNEWIDQLYKSLDANPSA